MYTTIQVIRQIKKEHGPVRVIIDRLENTGHVLTSIRSYHYDEWLNKRVWWFSFCACNVYGSGYVELLYTIKRMFCLVMSNGHMTQWQR